MRDYVTTRRNNVHGNCLSHSSSTISTVQDVLKSISSPAPAEPSRNAISADPALDDIPLYCGRDRDVSLADRMRQDATLRKLEVIGQAVKNLSEHAKSLQPEIPWKQIAQPSLALRDVQGIRDSQDLHADRPRLPTCRVSVRLRSRNQVLRAIEVTRTWAAMKPGDVVRSTSRQPHADHRGHL
jgi:hypothetical protein